jgi:hypothetical protein
MATNVYIDGFNFYYGLSRVEQAYPGSSYKWVDHEALALAIYPKLSPIGRIRYFTAHIQPMNDPLAPVRQQVYLRALRARKVEVHLGLFVAHTKVTRLRGAVALQPPAVDALVLSAEAHITKYGEKGSDCNLASYLIRDAALQDCNAAIVVSSDSDLAGAVRIARTDFNLPVYIVSPRKREVSELRSVANDLRTLKGAAVLASQFPATMIDAVGQFTRPPTW